MTTLRIVITLCVIIVYNNKRERTINYGEVITKVVNLNGVLYLKCQYLFCLRLYYRPNNLITSALIKKIPVKLKPDEVCLLISMESNLYIKKKDDFLLLHM